MTLPGTRSLPDKKKLEPNSAASMTIRGETIELPVYSGTMGPDVVDISKFYSQTGCFTYDPGYTSTGSCRSDITFIDGDEGILLHRS
jgi:citrate synthase